MRLCKVVFLSLMAMVTYPSYGDDAPVSLGECDQYSASVSAVELISDNARFDGWKVLVIGVLYYEGHRDKLYVSRERYSLADATSSLSLDLNSMEETPEGIAMLREITGQYVYVQGRMKSFPRQEGREGQVILGSDTAGVIEDVTCIGIAPEKLKPGNR